jgi:hypothetical protein
MLQAMLNFFTKPEIMINAALKTRSGGKAGYTYVIKKEGRTKIILPT